VSILKKLLKGLMALLVAVVLLSVAAYWTVPPLTRALYDVPAIEGKLATRLLPSDQPSTVR
jgi:hypothetical protein